MIKSTKQLHVQAKKKNPQDATMRNVRATATRVKDLDKRVRRLERIFGLRPYGSK